MESITLNNIYSLYSNGKINRAELESFIYTYYFFNQEKTCLSHWKRDEYEDYISWFYPRLRKAIDSYSCNGSNFEAYMGKVVFVSSREYHIRTTTNSVTEYSAWCARVPEMYAREDPPFYLNEKNENVLFNLIDDKNGKKNTRRILALIIKCYYYLSEDFLDKIAPKIGMNKIELREMYNKIRKIRQEKDDNIHELKERIYCQFYRCLSYENRLIYLHESSVAYNKLKDRLKKARTRLEKMRKRLSTIRTDATNRQVAEIIGASKGTVDSSLHKLKIRFNHLMEKSYLN